MPPKFMKWQEQRVNFVPGATTSGKNPTKIKNHTANLYTWDDGRQEIYLFGGYDGRKNHNDIHILDCNTLLWSKPKVNGDVPEGRNGHTATLAQDSLYIQGGWLGRGPLAANDIHVFDILSKTWIPSDFEGEPPGPCNMHTSNYLDHKKSIFVFRGGDGKDYLNDLHILDVGQLEKSTLKKQATDTLLGNMRLLLNNPDMFPDVVFIIENKKIYAHKAIIAVQCDVFKAMLSNGMKESKQQEIQIHEWSYDSFLSMLEFLYTGQIEQFDANSAVNLLSLVDHYTLDGLRELCENTLIRSIKLDNACLLLRMSEQSGAQMLKKYCLQYVLSNFEKIVETKAFDDLKSDPQLLLEITKASMGRKK